MTPVDKVLDTVRDAMRIRLLGRFQVSIGARSVGNDEWRSKKAIDLVKLLALAPGHHIHRERAMYLLWPELGPSAAANNLRQALHRTRQVLDSSSSTAGSSQYVQLKGEQLALCPDNQIWVDVEAFEAAATMARRSRDPAAYRAALNLYAGELLPEDRYEDWAEDRREALRSDRLTLLIEMANLFEERGDLRSAIDSLREAVSVEPAHEEAHAGLMRLYAMSGQRYQSLRQYEHLREALQRRFGTEPDTTSRLLHQEIVAGRLPAVRAPHSDYTPPEKVPDIRRHNVPDALSSFVGRESEKVDIERALAMTRLLTLTGVGGCGKTRLALEVIRDVAGTYPDGAWLAELASLSDPELVPQAVAAALGVREQPNQPPLETLEGALRDQELLLVLDNCEHLLDACADLAQTILGSCPGLQILTTSREPLGVAGEVTWMVPPLSVPEAGRPNEVEEIAATESVLLFLERARYRRPTFALREQDVPAVKEICRRLDGIPLAIELAAARVGTMSLEQIAARLGDSLGLLTGGSRTALPRQQTLRGALAWSHDLLSEREQMLFAHLSIFAGGWTLEAAEAVASGDGVEEGEVLDLLSGLVDKSLVVAEATADGEVRYRLLEPVRQYAWEQLAKSGEPNELRSRHAAYFLAEAELTEPELVGPRQGWWLDRLEREHANMRAALSWAFLQGDGVGLQLAVALSRFWYIRGYLSEARRWLERGLTVNGESPTLVRAKALGEAGRLAEEQVEYERARLAYEESLNIYRKLGDDKGVADTLGNLGSVTLFQGDHDRAARLLEEHLRILRRSGSGRDIALAIVRLGLLAVLRDKNTRATTLFEEALSLLRKVGDIRSVAVTLNNLGFATLSSGNSERARALFEEALSKNQEVGDTRGVAASLLNLGLAALSLADYERAEELLRESLKTLADAEDEQAVVECLEAMAGVAGARGQAERAARLWGVARALREGIGASMVPGERTILEPHLASAHSQLGPEAWDAALTEGRGMTSEQAVEYGLSEEEPVPHVSPTPNRRQPVRAPADVLTNREEEVATLVAQGLSNRQIAQELYLSERTIENHVSKILRKLGRTSRTEIAAWATQQRLIAPEPD